MVALTPLLSTPSHSTVSAGAEKISFRHGKMTLENSSPELLTVLIRELTSGGMRGTLLYGLIGTCRLNGINPEAYLRHILSVLPEWPSCMVDELPAMEYGAPIGVSVNTAFA